VTAVDAALVIDKPAGITSHDVVDVVRARFGTRRVGHGGTLDPDATGVLLVGLGRATRLLSYAQASPKRYRAVARLGVTTTTQDASGAVIERRRADLDGFDVMKTMVDFVGDVEQIPPMVSAVKVGGERLYRKARRGEEIERPPRRVRIFELDLVDFSVEAQEATLDVLCSGGTYVRSLVHDLGARLGCGAHLASLRRTGAGPFSERDAIALDAVAPKHLRPLVDVVGSMSRIEVGDEAARRVTHGAQLERNATLALRDGSHVALLHDGRLLAVYRVSGDRLIADRVVGS
jgi:tRNA pseudouridine55 synthase